MKRKLHNYRQKSIFTVVLISLLFLVNPDTVWAFQDQEQITSFTQYKGEVLDEDTKRPLVFATLTLEGSNVSTVSNTEGEFALKIPTSISEGNVRVSFLGYKTRILPLAQFTTENNQIFMKVSVLELTEVNLSIPKDARALVQEALKRRGENYFDDPTLMTAFYRETIKRRRKNVSLSEAVVNIYKTPYTSDKKDAMQLYKAAAQHAYPEAQYQLALMFARGQGVQKSEEQAVHWISKAAKLNHPMAQYGLGAYLINGVGVEQDMFLAAYWISLAAAQGQEHAVKARDSVLQNLNEQELKSLNSKLEHGIGSITPIK